MGRYGHTVNRCPTGQHSTHTLKGHNMARAINPGTLVIDHAGHEYVYGGQHEMAGMMSIRFGIGSGGPSEIRCDMDQVAPAAEVPEVNLKDGRILVTKMGSKPAFASGPWRHLIVLPDGTTHTGWHKTKRDGTAESAYRLAIADWHAAVPTEVVRHHDSHGLAAVLRVPAETA